MTILQHCQLVVWASLRLEKAPALLLALQLRGPDLVLMIGLEVSV